MVIFLGIWGEAELFLGIWGAKANNFREMRTLFAGRRGDQCIIFRDQGSKDPPPPPGGDLSRMRFGLGDSETIQRERENETGVKNILRV